MAIIPQGPTISQLQVPEYSGNAPSAFDFAPLSKMIEAANQQRTQQAQLQSLASLAPQDGTQPGMPSPMPRQAAVPYTSAGASGYGGGGGVGGNVQSWYDFARKPLDQGGLGLSPEQAAGKVANLQAESGSKIPSWGATGDGGTAWGAAQWRGPRLAGLQKFAADHGLDYRGTEAQQGFMRQEYLGPEYSAYQKLTAARTPQQAATAVNRFYERSADNSGSREANALRLFNQFGGAVMATIPTLQIPQMGAVSGGADFAPLANLGNLYQKYQQDQTNKAAFAAFQQTGDPRALIGSGDMNLAQLGISAQNHLDTLKQQALENKRADINVGLAQAQGRRADAAEGRTADEFKNTPYQFRENPDGTITDLYAEAAAAAKAKAAAQAIPDNYELHPDFGKVEGAPRLRAIPGGPADPTVLASQAEAKAGGGMGEGAIELAARRLKEGDLTALTNIGRGAQAAHDLSRIQNKMADILVKEEGLSMADAAKRVSSQVQAFKASQTGQSAEARTGATREANLNLILKATDAAIPAALEASDNVARTGWVPLNKVIQKGQLATSDPNLMKFGMANLQLAEHWARAMNPTGVMRESDREKALEFLGTATDKATYKALVEQLRTQITRERDAVKGAAPGASSPYSSPSTAPATPGATPAGGTKRLKFNPETGQIE